MDLGPELVELARRRLPHWRDRLWVGNAQTWRPPDGRRFDFVQLRPDAVRPDRRPALLDHLRRAVLAADGRLIVTLSEAGPSGSPRALLQACGFSVTGENGPVAWTDLPGD